MASVEICRVDLTGENKTDASLMSASWWIVQQNVTIRPKGALRKSINLSEHKPTDDIIYPRYQYSWATLNLRLGDDIPQGFIIRTPAVR